MTDTAIAPPAVSPMPASQARPFLPALVLLFIGSGSAALIYEIAWLQMLGLEIGNSTISLGVLLGTFMGGMCIGSLIFSRIVPRRMHPMLVYAILEAAIAVVGLLELWLIPTATGMYVHFAQPGAGAVALRSIIAGVCLLPPTILMGATLPAIARYVEATPQGVSWMGFFYGGNIVGAVVGVMLAGFYLLPTYDRNIATYAAMGINFSVAIIAILLSTMTEYVAPPKEESTVPTVAAPGAWAVYVSIALSGLTGLGAEVVWTRQLGLMLGATVYTFTNILSVFLLGLGIGSSVGAFVARSAKDAKSALAWCQFLLAGAIAWAAYSITYSIPFWPVDPTISNSTSYTYQVNLAACFWALLPGAVLWGASFPIALAAIARRGQDPGKLVGSVYAANTVGAILGSVLFSMVFLRYFGSQVSQQLLMVLCIVSGMVAVAPLFDKKPTSDDPSSSISLGGLSVGIALAVIVSLGLVLTVSGPNWGAVAWGRNSATEMHNLFPAVLTTPEYEVVLEANRRYLKSMSVKDDQIVFEEPNLISPDNKKWAEDNRTLLISAMKKREKVTGKASIAPYNESQSPGRYCVYVGEGMNVSVAVTYDPNGFKYFHGAGKVQASSNPMDMRLQRTLGHITALTYYAQTTQTPKDVLVVACGAGVTAGSFVPYDCNITIVDIEYMVPKYVTPQFWDMNHDVIPESWSERASGYKKTNIIIDDGRHYVKTTNKKFDVITSDPIDPWVKGCAALNTVEYYEMCKAHLNPGGIMALWIPLYESSEETTKSIIATFFKVFPNGIIWSNDDRGRGYDCTLFGSVGLDPKDSTTPLRLNIDEIQAYIDDPDHAAVKESLHYVHYGESGVPGSSEAVDLLATFAGTAPRMKEWTKNTEHLINTDRNLRLQYVAGQGVNKYEQERIFNNILKHYSFPSEIFEGSPARIEALKTLLNQTGRYDSTVRP